MSLSAVNVTTTAAIVVPANINRRVLFIQNVADTDIYYKFDESATALTTANGAKLAAGAELLLTATPNEFRNPLWAIHGGVGSKELRIQEAT